MTLQEIMDRVTRSLGDIALTQVNATDFIAWGNHGQIRIVRETECLQGIQQTNVVAGTASYALPVDFLKYKRVTLDGKPLGFTTLEELDQYDSHRDVSNTQATPAKFYRWNQSTYLFPIPAAAGTANLDVWYIRQPAALTAIGNTPSIPVQYHETLLLYCKAKAYEQIENYDMARLVMQEFQAELAEAQYDESTPLADSYPGVRAVIGDNW